MRFDIHQKLVNQTHLMSGILKDAKDSDCSDTIKIFLLCPGEELEKLVQFLHNGKIECKNEEESLEILKSLKNLLKVIPKHQRTRRLTVRKPMQLSLQSNAKIK